MRTDDSNCPARTHGGVFATTHWSVVLAATPCDSPQAREGVPFFGGGVCLGVWQYNYDGLQPAAVATFDNFEVRKHEIPPLGIARAVRLSWMAPAGVNYAVEGAPTVQGPWLPVQDPARPGMSQTNLPANELMKFFRLVQAP